MDILQFLKDNYEISEKDSAIVLKCLEATPITEKLIFVLNEIKKMKLDLSSCLAYIFKQFYDEHGEEKTAAVIKNAGADEKNIFEALKFLKTTYKNRRSEEVEDLRKMFIAMSKDLRVVIIRLLSIKYDISKINLPLKLEEESFISDVKNIFAPLAERLGLNVLKSELEDLCLKLQEPEIYRELESNVMLKKDENQAQIELTKSKLQDILDDLGIKGEIMARQKHFSSVYKKMKTKHVTLAQIYDLVAMRILVNTVEECYAVFGRVHGIYKPMPGRVKDYIAMPKANGYRSLHTTIVAENNRPLEIQIRTYEMHKVSEYGVAAHWIYKEKRNKTTSLDEKLGWVREIMEGAKNLSSEEFIETLKTNLYGGEIFVQTPKGKVLEFPDGSTVIDFAYAIHSEIGNSCVGAKINGKIQPLTTALKNGDIVEIITSSNSKGPSRDWLKNIKTASARSKINAFFKKELKEDNIKDGKVLFDLALKNKNLNLKDILIPKYEEEILYKYSMQNLDELYAAIGYGSLTASQVISTLINFERRDNTIKKPRQEVDNTLVIKSDKNGILIDGDSGMLIRYANCCTPTPGEGIIGYISRGRGVTIHRDNCANLKYLEKERIIRAEWDNTQAKEFVALIKILCEDNPSILPKITSVIAEKHTNLKNFDAKSTANGAMISCKVLVNNKDLIFELIEELKKVDGVTKVYRSE